METLKTSEEIRVFSKALAREQFGFLRRFGVGMKAFHAFIMGVVTATVNWIASSATLRRSPPPLKHDQATSTQPPPPPDDWEFVQELGAGQYGKVYRVKNRLDGRTMAMKCVGLRPGAAASRDMERATAEIRIMAELSGRSKNVVAYMGAVTLNFDPFEGEVGDGSSMTGTDSPGFSDISSSVGDRRQDNNNMDDLFKSPPARLSLAEDDRALADKAANSTSTDKTRHMTTNELPRCVGILMEECNTDLDKVMTTIRKALDEGRMTSSSSFAAEVNRMFRFEAKNEADKIRGFFNPMYIVGEIFCGLQYIHSRQIVHRDIKPGNVLVDRIGGRIKIADFGLAKQAKDLPGAMTTTAYAVGTPVWAAPEVLDVRRHLTLADWKTADMYSVGMVLLKLATFQFSSDSELIRTRDKIDAQSSDSHLGGAVVGKAIFDMFLPIWYSFPQSYIFGTTLFEYVVNRQDHARNSLAVCLYLINKLTMQAEHRISMRDVLNEIKKWLPSTVNKHLKIRHKSSDDSSTGQMRQGKPEVMATPDRRRKIAKKKPKMSYKAVDKEE